MYNAIKFEDLIGKTFSRVEANRGAHEVVFYGIDGAEWKMYHDQDCCETVTLEDVVGHIEDLVGEPILQAEESTNRGMGKSTYTESCTWTFYRLATVKGAVTLRWYGESNGYYSESVNVYQTAEGAEETRVAEIERTVESLIHDSDNPAKAVAGYILKLLKDK